MIERRKVLVGLAGLCCSVSWPGGLKGAIGNEPDAWFCNATGDPVQAYASDLIKPAPEAIAAVTWISQTVGLAPNFQVWTGAFTRKVFAYATYIKDHRVIVYDQEEFDWLPGKPNWLHTGVMAHEVGHHLNGHTARRIGEPWDRELEADRFAGFALGRLGASLDQALLWTHILNEEGSDTHPPRARRAAAGQAGWEHAQAMKKRERGACQTEWLTDALEIGGGQCRVAKVCQPEAVVRLACRAPGGTWRWRR